MNTLSRIAIETEDWFRSNRLLRTVLCWFKMLRELRPGSQHPQKAVRSIQRLCAAARLAPDAVAMRAAERMIAGRLGRLDVSQVDWRKFTSGRRMGKAVVLKPWVSKREKGVIFVSFEGQWAQLALLKDLQDFADHYILVVSPTWSPPHDFVNCVFPKLFPGPIFCLISNRRDQEIFPRLSSKYIVVPLFASSWVNPHLYKPIAFEKKDIDVIMVANFAKYKRHHALFRALFRMPSSLHVVLIGQAAPGRAAGDILAEARAFGVENRFELWESVPDAKVVDALCRAKISVILSRREGSCVSIMESMFANTPVAALAGAEIGSLIYINAHTGRLLRHRGLAEQLMDFLGEAHRYAPRQWAENNLSCFQSTQTLNGILKSHALAAGEEWTQDIVVHHWRPDPLLVSEQDRRRLAPAYEHIRQRFGITIGIDGVS